VGVVKAERRPIAKAGDLVGRVEAISRVEIRARITGFPEKMLFKEGDRIKEGSLCVPKTIRVDGVTESPKLAE
jgi:membrane fusion protein, multidrug efflux system